MEKMGGGTLWMLMLSLTLTRMPAVRAGIVMSPIWGLALDIDIDIDIDANTVLYVKVTHMYMPLSLAALTADFDPFSFFFK